MKINEATTLQSTLNKNPDKEMQLLSITYGRLGVNWDEITYLNKYNRIFMKLSKNH